MIALRVIGALLGVAVAVLEAAKDQPIGYWPAES